MVFQAKPRGHEIKLKKTNHVMKKRNTKHAATNSENIY